MHTPAEIRELDLSVYSHQNILWFDIPMDDMLAMQVLQSAGHLRNILSRLPLWEPIRPPQVFE